MSILNATKFRYREDGEVEAYIPIHGSWNQFVGELPADAVFDNERPRIMFRKFITRDMLRTEPQVLFVFGDNLLRKGSGGQAKDMRGEPNAVGLPTKKEPSMQPTAFFGNEDFEMWKKASYDDWKRLFEHLKQGGSLVWPSNGIGTGLANLQETAPDIEASIKRNLQAMIAIADRHI
tara:strand:- start:1612 stop:2142 length:531 start_codon:yes stop_codon:yes gene_type:complete